MPYIHPVGSTAGFEVVVVVLYVLQDQLLFCDDCDRGYHMYCLKPPLSEPPEGSGHFQIWFSVQMFTSVLAIDDAG